MSSKKLRKYLAFYRKTLQEDPENIEARLRLAVLFREMGRIAHAIEEYSTAAKLLASQGLPLEAIAACKTILELDPSHQDTQFFLARLYARVPEATGDVVRVARPMEGTSGPVRAGTDPGRPMAAIAAEEVAITLESPKMSRAELATTIETDYGEAITSPVPAKAIPRFDEEELYDGDVTSVERPSQRRLSEESTGERTVMQNPLEQEVLRDQAEVEEFQDEQVVDLALFDLESLELDDDDTVDWEDRVSLWEGQEEPSTRELMLDDTSGVRPRPKQMRKEFRISALPEIPLFSKLPRQVFLDFLNAMEMGRAQPGEVILSPDDPASGLFVIMRGWVRVERELSDGRVVELAQMGEGEVFGEFRLLTGDDRESQVVAETEVEFFAVSDEVVYEIGRDHPEMWDVLWGFYYERMLNHSMAASEIFGNLNAEERDLVARHFDLSEALADDVLFRIGESVEYLSLIVSGSVEIRVGSDAVTTLQQGDFLGVTPCAIDGPAGATAVAQTDLVLLQMPGRIFRDLLYGLPDVAEAVRQEVRERNAVAGVEEDRPLLTKLL